MTAEAIYCDSRHSTAIPEQDGRSSAMHHGMYQVHEHMTCENIKRGNLSCMADYERWVDIIPNKSLTTATAKMVWFMGYAS